MMKQSTLTDNAPRILDSTCSFGKKYPKHASVRIDIRPETNPDIVMDAKDLKFPDNYFDEIYCDPPHYFKKSIPARIKELRRRSGRVSPDSFTRYGHWKSVEEWFEFVDKTNISFHRCLKEDGILWYKITEGGGCTKPLDLITRMTNFRLLEDKSRRSGSPMGNAKTHFLKFKVIK